MRDVAIVGYRQVGLSVCVCDRLKIVGEIPPAISLDHEILRRFQQLGVIDAVRLQDEPHTPSEFFGVDDQLIAQRRQH
jgi:3-(3-hydroxy-phenyl)propionate hydroxylase